MAAGATPADMHMLWMLGLLAGALGLMFLFVRQDVFRLETFRKAHFTLFADREPDTAVFEFLGNIRRARQRHLRLRREASTGHSVADEIRKLAGLVTEKVLTSEEFMQKKRELLELEGVREFSGDVPDLLDDGDEGGPRSIN
jgi:hypothetical protein